MIPSVKTLAAHWPNKAKVLRKIMETPSAVNELSQWDRLSAELGGCGREFISHGRNSKSPAIAYVNMGDPYVTTLMKINRNWRVGCWGDIVERGNYE